jgi:hypothetical protein
MFDQESHMTHSVTRGGYHNCYMGKFIHVSNKTRQCMLAMQINIFYQIYCLSGKNIELETT